MADLAQESVSDSAEMKNLAETVREACIQAAIRGYENAAMSGLCAEGAFESAISAIRMLDLSEVGKSPPGDSG